MCYHLAQRHEETFDVGVFMRQIGWCGYLRLLEHLALLLTSNGPYNVPVDVQNSTYV